MTRSPEAFISVGVATKDGGSEHEWHNKTDSCVTWVSPFEGLHVATAGFGEFVKSMKNTDCCGLVESTDVRPGLVCPDNLRQSDPL